ncbi:STAS domain-containing protein [Sphingomonas sp. AP4-R1]|uniref:STAS domain-containing protein n=1 Tax=Sphingomonas sp. AP4-R1 TaxID=2735134 RepID=UPI001493B92A|nr:STAS domain-containing protein [Sphingomonas sp. AP4-R1]QJU58858.1 STAS domain-containing protein [Sphingomonas sp. AP4-R1]
MMSPTQQLPPILDTAAAGPLAIFLRARLEEEGALILDASTVSQLGQACLQVLLSARRDALARGRSFTIVDPSEPFRALATMVGAGQLCAEVVA